MSIQSYSLSSSSESIEWFQESVNDQKIENNAPIVCTNATEWYQELENNPESKLEFKSTRRSGGQHGRVTVDVIQQDRRIVSNAIQQTVTELFPSTISSTCLIKRDEKK